MDPYGVNAPTHSQPTGMETEKNTTKIQKRKNHKKQNKFDNGNFSFYLLITKNWQRNFTLYRFEGLKVWERSTF